MAELTPWEQFKQDAQKFAETLPNISFKETSPLDFLNPATQYVEKEEAERRLDICKECPFVIKSTLQCTKCGCFMKAKTLLAKATCPEHNW